MKLVIAIIQPKTLAIHHCQSENFDFSKSCFDVLKLTGLNDRNNEFHEARPMRKAIQVPSPAETRILAVNQDSLK